MDQLFYNKQKSSSKPQQDSQRNGTEPRHK